MENILAQIAKHLGVRFARIENLFATKKELQTLTGELNTHRDNLDIHKTSAQIRAEITDADLPATITRDTDLTAAINTHNDSDTSHTDLRETIAGIQNGNITVPRSEYAEKLGTPGDSYTKAQLEAVMNTHFTDDTRHKTPGEQNKLDHLADNPDATYATKTEIDAITPFTIRITIDAAGKYIVPEEDKTRLYAYLLADGKPEHIQVKMNDEKNQAQENTYQCSYSNIVDNHAEKRSISGGISFLYSTVSPKWITGKCITISVRYMMINTSITKSIGVSHTEYTTDFYSNAVCQLLAPDKTINLDTIDQTGGFDGLCLDDTYIAIGLPEGFVSVPGVPLSFSGMTLVQSVGGKSQILFNRANGDMYTRATNSNNAWLPWKKQAQADKCEPIVFTGTYTVLNAALEDRKYTLDTGQTDKFTSYFIQAKTNPVILQFSLAGEPVAPEQETFLLNKTFTNGARYDLEFISLRPGKLKKIMLRMTKSSSGVWGSNITLVDSEYAFGTSEYKYDRYYYLDGSFDMDKFTESGGIAAAVYEASEGIEAVVGQNIPPGFTEFYGYVLANDGGNRDKCCTQVVTDRDLQKTMMRSSIRSSTLKNTWTEWKEIGCENKILVVTEYPADLSTYADGTIFIKQPQA